MTRWSEGAGNDISGETYASRFDNLAARGVDVHGEASFCQSLLPPNSSVLDAGCGTGRVAIELASRGFRCVGVDVDTSMLAVAARRAPDIAWVEADLVDLRLDESFDLVVAAGNVVPLVAEGTERAAVERLVAHLVAGGLLVTGFGLDDDHLPPAAGHVRLEDYDAWCAAAGLTTEQRWATWGREPYADGGYAVSVHRRGS